MENMGKLTIKHDLLTDRVHILEDRSLRLDDVSTADEGEYSCEADNAVGSVSAVGTLTVYCAYLEMSTTCHFSYFVRAEAHILLSSI